MQSFLTISKMMMAKISTPKIIPVMNTMWSFDRCALALLCCTRLGFGTTENCKEKCFLHFFGKWLIRDLLKFSKVVSQSARLSNCLNFYQVSDIRKWPMWLILKVKFKFSISKYSFYCSSGTVIHSHPILSTWIAISKFDIDPWHHRGHLLISKT